MNKALESLDRIAKQIELDDGDDFWEIRNAHKFVEQELLRLENQDDVIDNCIKCLEADMPKSAITMLYALRDRKRRVC